MKPDTETLKALDTMQETKPVEDIEYLLMGHITVRRVYEPNTEFLCYGVKPFTKGAPIHVQAGRIDIPAYQGCCGSDAERVQNCIALCVRALRELNTGMKRTCLDRL